MKDRRQSSEFDLTFDGKRKWDKIASFVFFALLVFLLGLFIVGCESAPTVSRFPAVDCKAHPDAFRCKAYVPEPDVELDDFEDVEGH